MISTHETLEAQTVEHFRSRFGAEPVVLASSPGRVNLIGEHTDYNEGYVLPAAIDRRTAVAAGPRSDGKLSIFAANLHACAQAGLNDLASGRIGVWSGYIRGVAHLLMARHEFTGGANLCVFGTIPRGSGLSSSAALEVATAHALMALNGITLPHMDVIRLCQQAEHQFAGVKCGIMDQCISALGKADTALFLDCRSLQYRHVPLPSRVRIIICDTGVKRALAATAYNLRREECAAGVAALRESLPGITSLRDVTPALFAEHMDRLDPVVRRRCKHVITENARVERAASDLSKNDMSEFGKLMYDSHMSLQHDYEVSCAELDAVVDICAEQEGVFGARMTGAGFGGCAIALVDADYADAVATRLAVEFPQKTGRTPKVIIARAEDGVRVCRLD